MIKFLKRKWKEYNDIEDDFIEVMKFKHIAHLMSSSNVGISGKELSKCINSSISHGYMRGVEKGIFVGVIVGVIFGLLL